MNIHDHLRSDDSDTVLQDTLSGLGLWYLSMSKLIENAAPCRGGGYCLRPTVGDTYHGLASGLGRAGGPVGTD